MKLEDRSLPKIVFVIGPHERTFPIHSLNFVKLAIMVGCSSIVFLPSCKTVSSPDSSIDPIAARVLSDSLAANLMKDRRDLLRQELETSFRESVAESELNVILSQIFETYGKPVELEFKQDELGLKTSADGAPKSVRKFWYAARTTKFNSGQYFLIVEIVRDGAGLGVASFSIVSFSDGVPASLR